MKREEVHEEIRGGERKQKRAVKSTIADSKFNF